MTENAVHIAQLIEKYLLHTLSSAERDELQQWRSDSIANEALFAEMTDPDHALNKVSRFFAYDRKRIAEKMRALNPDLQLHEPLPAPVQRIHFLRVPWFRYAAAILLLTAGTAIYLYLHVYQASPSPKEIAGTTPQEKPAGIPPGGNKAILTLSDGRRIVLDSAANGSLAQQGGTKIIKLNAGSLTYNSGTSASQESLYNIISTPKGGQYQITLPDGTKVWLNAASSIRFPTTFAKERTVEITGESYLEVAADKTKPFFVKAETITIQVLGTSFNINAYTDEKDVKTTLIEGSVKIVKGTNSLVLRPGQQAEVTHVIQLNKRVDTEQVMAWKNGRFNFTDVSLEEVMRQLTRWYDIEVVYPQGVPDIRFLGKISRDMPLANLLEALKQSEVHFTLQGRRLNVLP